MTAPKITVTPEVAAFLLQIIDGLQLQASNPQFEQAAAMIVKARQELTAAKQG